MSEVNALLTQLRDVHLPEPIGLWPLAWGWWLLIASVFFVSIIGWGWLKWKKFFQKKLFLRQLLKIQQSYQQNQDAEWALHQVAYLLKQAALYYYPREQVASLHGEAWVSFLQLTSNQQANAEVTQLFTQALYQPQYASRDVDLGFKFAKQWLKRQRLLCMN